MSDLRLRQARVTADFKPANRAELREALRDALAVADELLVELARMRDHIDLVLVAHRGVYTALASDQPDT